MKKFRVKIVWRDKDVEYCTMEGRTPSEAVENLPISYDDAQSIQVLGEDRQ